MAYLLGSLVGVVLWLTAFFWANNDMTRLGKGGIGRYAWLVLFVVFTWLVAPFYLLARERWARRLASLPVNTTLVVTDVGLNAGKLVPVIRRTLRLPLPEAAGVVRSPTPWNLGPLAEQEAVKLKAALQKAGATVEYVDDEASTSVGVAR